MKLACIPILLLLSAPRVPSEDLRVEILVDLDKNEFTQAEEVSGTLTMSLHWTKDSPFRDHPTVTLNGPQMSLQVEPSPRWGTIVSEFTPPLENPVKIGKRYVVRFKITPSSSLTQSLAATGKHVASFAAGAYSVRAKVASPGSHSALQSEVELIDSTGSDPKRFEVTAEPAKILSKQDLLGALEKAGATTRSDLVGYYESMGHPLRELSFFERPKRLQPLAHGEAPVFLQVPPGEEIRCTTKPPTDDITRSGCLILDGVASFPGLTTPEITIRAPKDEGLYKLTCGMHHDQRGPLGWLLVLKR